MYITLTTHTRTYTRTRAHRCAHTRTPRTQTRVHTYTTHNEAAEQTCLFPPFANRCRLQDSHCGLDEKCAPRKGTCTRVHRTHRRLLWLLNFLHRLDECDYIVTHAYHQRTMYSLATRTRISFTKTLQTGKRILKTKRLSYFIAMRIRDHSCTYELNVF